MKYTKKPEIIKYPDNQISIKLEEFPPYIDKRINSYEDLFVLKSIVDVYKHNKKELSQVFIPCLFGQRSDRRFNENQSFDLKNICDFINSCDISSVEIFDPHSDVCMGMINNSVKRSSFEFVQKTDADIFSKERIVPTLISPDSGAYKKVFEYGEKLNRPVMSAVKHRDGDGKIHLEFTGSVKDRICLIVDDLCEGGFTFIKLAEELKKNRAAKIYLYVSHGYFSKGFEVFDNLIDHIYCTNSVKDIEHKKITQYKII